MTNTQQFNPVTYKATTRDQWDAAAQEWDAWGPTLEAWLGEATELMLDLGQLAKGSRVLDVAAGGGRPEHRRSAAGRQRRARARDRHLGRDPGLRAAPVLRERPRQRYHETHGR